MLRRTAARAFGSGDPAPSTAPVPDGPTRPGWDARSAAVDRLFDDLVESVRAALQRLEQEAAPAMGTAPGATEAEAEAEAAAQAEAEAAGSPSAPLPLVTGPRAEVDGYRFTVEGPGGRVRVTNTLQGFVLLGSEAEGVPPVEELLTLERREGETGWRPLRKLLLPSPARTPFRYTSVEELARDCIHRAWRGIRTVLG